jgi:hypothetical protein
VNQLNAFLITGALIALLSSAPAQAATILIQADQVLHPISPFLTGACLEDVNHEVYGGIYSQMIFGESFQEPATKGSFGAAAACGSTLAPGPLRANARLRRLTPLSGRKAKSSPFPVAQGRLGLPIKDSTTGAWLLLAGTRIRDAWIS